MKNNDEGSGIGASAGSAARRGRGGRLARPRGSFAPIAVVAAVALALSACGGGSSNTQGVAALPSTTTRPETVGGGPSSSQGVAGAGSTTSSSAVAGGAVTTLPSAVSPQTDALEFAECVRSHGIANFPDPSSGGGFVFHASAGIIQSPQYQAAQKACQKYMPPGPGSGPPPSKQALAQMLKVSQCMRRHGITHFPDPMTSVPPHALAGVGGVISDIYGVILVFPSTIDEQSPQFTHAAAACEFPLHNH
ncbi:MAG TPA: hypothetical protein VMS00_12605 [Acidimicrobiales bacterium]|nr:hypothetical protein [Acidimicrobiales bacterium]